MSTNPSDNEDAYFQKRNQELRAQLREQMSKAAGALEENPGADKLSVIDRISALGFTGDKLKIFDLLPLIHVAWADGSVNHKERTAILDVVRARGIAPSTEAWVTVESLLEQRPSQTFLDQSLAILKDSIGGSRSANIVDLCVQVAGAAGGFLNIGTINDEEKQLIARIAEGLGGPALEEFRKQFD